LRCDDRRWLAHGGCIVVDVERVGSTTKFGAVSGADHVTIRGGDRGTTINDRVTTDCGLKISFIRVALIKVILTALTVMKSSLGVHI